LLSIAVCFYVLGAPFAAVLEAIVYAGAIMVLFLFVIMMLNMGQQSLDQERSWMGPKVWLVPSILTSVLLAQLLPVLPRYGQECGAHIRRCDGGQCPVIRALCVGGRARLDTPPCGPGIGLSPGEEVETERKW